MPFETSHGWCVEKLFELKQDYFTQTSRDNAINGKNRILYILMILSHYTRDTALCVQCEIIIKIYKVLLFPLIAMTHRVIARRLC